MFQFFCVKDQVVHYTTTNYNVNFLKIHANICLEVVF